MTSHPEPIAREPRAAPNRWPYHEHRTVAQVDAELTERARLMSNGGVLYRTVARVLGTSESHVAVMVGEWRAAA